MLQLREILLCLVSVLVSPIRRKKEAAWISVPFFSNAQVDVPVCWEGMFQVGGHVIELYIQVQGSMVSYAMIKKKNSCLSVVDMKL